MKKSKRIPARSSEKPVFKPELSLKEMFKIENSIDLFTVEGLMFIAEFYEIEIPEEYNKADIFYAITKNLR